MTGAERLQVWLKRKGACYAARRWCKGKTFRQAWATCRNGAWLQFAAFRIDSGRSCVVWAGWMDSSERKPVLEAFGRAYWSAKADYYRKHFRIPKGWQP